MSNQMIDYNYFCFKMVSLSLYEFEHYDVSKMNHDQLREFIYSFYKSHEQEHKWSLINWHLSPELTSLDNLFCYCSLLTSIDISWWNVESITSARNMFYGCSSLRMVDMRYTSFDRLAYSTLMFCGCDMLNMIVTSYCNLLKMTENETTFTSSTDVRRIQFLVPRDDHFDSLFYDIDLSTNNLFVSIMGTLSIEYATQLIHNNIYIYDMTPEELGFQEAE